ncbi:hypothetical protein GYMLUDRAFT_923651 [Collybiopsis luxurians FD-317 M1]|uniref:Uncharacterized protein n=1 Tax=Collybiopsis luxurians FD-317 M1 TaxID=944289 RepID=A0A0D0CFW3_9AGAR|nr:hypothetical protein GYMLUDRAFT_923651 [Collybiopsis luxurians FD-317 M1]
MRLAKKALLSTAVGMMKFCISAMFDRICLPYTFWSCVPPNRTEPPSDNATCGLITIETNVLRKGYGKYFRNSETSYCLATLRTSFIPRVITSRIFY